MFFATFVLSQIYIWMQTERKCECSMWKQSHLSMWTCYRGEANSIRLCSKCSGNSRMLSVDCWYFKGNLHTIRLCRVDSLPRQMLNSVRMYHIFCLASHPHVLFAFIFTCKPGFIISASVVLTYIFKKIRNWMQMYMNE